MASAPIGSPTAAAPLATNTTPLAASSPPPARIATFAFDPASNLVNTGSSIASQSNSNSNSNSNNLPGNIPAIVGNLLKEYAGTHFEYDARGNLLKKTRNGVAQEFTWDGFNRLQASQRADGKTEYAYAP